MLVIRYPRKRDNVGGHCESTARFTNDGRCRTNTIWGWGGFQAFIFFEIQNVLGDDEVLFQNVNIKYDDDDSRWYPGEGYIISIAVATVDGRSAGAMFAD